MWNKLTEILKGIPCTVRIAFRDGTKTEWAKSLFLPTQGYGETGKYGPFRLADVAAVEINPIEIRRVGRLVPDRKIDHTQVLVSALQSAQIDSKRDAAGTILIRV